MSRSGSAMSAPLAGCLCDSFGLDRSAGGRYGRRPYSAANRRGALNSPACHDRLSPSAILQNLQHTTPSGRGRDGPELTTLPGDELPAYAVGRWRQGEACRALSKKAPRRSGRSLFGDRSASPPWPAHPGTYLQATAGSQRHFTLAKVLLSAQPQLRQACHRSCKRQLNNCPDEFPERQFAGDRRGMAYYGPAIPG
jgi:hypothetical protein